MKRYRGSLAFGLAAGALFTAYLAVAYYFVRCGRVNHDEGWYLYAARLVYEGKLPYHDFPFFQAPFLPYFYGLPQKLFGAGLEVGRFTSYALGVVTVALGARLSFERGGRLAALLFLAAAPLTPFFVWSFTTTRTEPLSALLLTASAFLLLRIPSGAPASSGALVAAVLAAGTRAALLPAAVMVALWVVLRHRDSVRELVIALAPGAAVAAALAAVALASGWEAALFNLVTVQAERHGQLKPKDPLGLGGYLLRRLQDLTLLRARFGIVPTLALASGFGAAAAWLVQRRDPAAAGSLPSAAAALAALGLVAYLPHFVPRVIFPIYFAAVVPLFLVLGAWVVGHLFERADRAGRWAISGALAALLLLQAATFAAQHDYLATPDDPDLPELRSVAEYLASALPEDATLVTMEAYLAVESGLRVAPGWEMSIFGYFPRRRGAESRRLGILTRWRVGQSLRSRAVGAAVLSDRALGILVKRKNEAYRPDHPLTEDELREALPELRRYRLDRVFPDFGQFDEYLYVLLPVRPR